MTLNKSQVVKFSAKSLTTFHPDPTGKLQNPRKKMASQLKVSIPFELSKGRLPWSRLGSNMKNENIGIRKGGKLDEMQVWKSRPASTLG